MTRKGAAVGIFDKLLKEGIDAVKEAVSEENKEKAKSVFNSLKEQFSDELETIKKAAEEYKAKEAAKEESIPQDTYEEIDDGKTCRERILECIATEFPQYHVAENVSPRELGGEGRFMDYSMLILDEDNKICLIIMLIGKTTTAHREYRWSREFAEEKGVKFINFVNHYPNRPEYISERLHKYL